MNNNVLENLKWRGIIKDIINPENIEKITKDNKNRFYIGIDPTADSMHLGHYITIVLTKLMQDTLKINPIFVIGGFTGQIGDPSGKNSERELITENKVKNNIKGIEKQINILSKNIGINDFYIINNNDFYEKMNIIDFFKTYGKSFNLNQMLSKESVKNRIETGISYTEFSYQIFQAIDFYNLFQKHNVKIQIGGSDQWGNIVSGVELIRKMNNKEENEISGVTINLLTDKNGNKIGKTQGTPIWLNKEKTSPYEFYQYFLNMDDETSMDLIKKLTLITENEYLELIKKHKQNPKERIVQNEFAKRVITLVHSEKEFLRSVEISKILFENKFNSLSISEFEEIFKNFEKAPYSSEKIIDFILKNELKKSKREIREFLSSNSIKINESVVNDENMLISSDMLIHGKYLILTIGKKNKYLVIK